MKKTTLLILVTLTTFLQAAARPVRDTVFGEPVQAWFKAWELLSRDIYGIQQARPVDFVFFDDQFVYSTSRISIPAGTPVKGPRLMNLVLNWKKAAYKDSIRLPDGSFVEAGILSFAGTTGTMKPFFVMPLPSFWAQAGVQSQELGLGKLVTGVFLHEFSHTQQVKGLGRLVTDMEKKYWPGASINDDIIQHHFGEDSLYTQDYQRETGLFYTAAGASQPQPGLLQEAVSLYDKRQATYFTGLTEGLTAADDLFLTMEGLGQFSMYAWLVHPKGGALPEDQALAGVRRGKKWWSQEEGLALFLALSRFRSPASWGPRFFSPQPVTVIRLLRQLIRQDQL